MCIASTYDSFLLSNGVRNRSLQEPRADRYYGIFLFVALHVLRMFLYIGFKSVMLYIWKRSLLLNVGNSRSELGRATATTTTAAALEQQQNNQQRQSNLNATTTTAAAIQQSNNQTAE